MKTFKLIFGFLACFCLCFAFSLGLYNAHAETVETEIVEETEETELTKEALIQKLKDKIDQNIEDGKIKDIIYLVLFSGFGTGLIGVYVKYRKYKHNTLEDVVKTVHNELAEFCTEQFNNLSVEKIAPVIEKVNELNKGIETITKVLVLMQDKTPEGRIALLEYLGVKTENADIKASVVEIEKNIEEQNKTAQEVNSKVKEEYNEIKVF